MATAEITARGGFLRLAAEIFFGGDEIRRRISSSDESYYMSNLSDGMRVPENLRPTIAYLMQRKLWRPTAENAVDAGEPMRRGDAIALLVDWLEAEKQDIVRRGDLVDLSGHKTDKAPGALKIRSGGSSREFRLARNLHLFRIDTGQATPIREIKLIGAEKLAFHLNDKNEIDFLEIELSPSGAASDRLSYAATWKTTLTRASVAEKLRSLIGDIGTLRDLQPSRLGFSGRAVQIQAIGSNKTTVLNGYRLRGALDLRDTLFTLTREFNADGVVTSFTFSGRGFGHGIGLCQTGAYGMAKAGRHYTEILKTYYTGVEIKNAY
jgi:stage II sporulation protein D